MSDCRRAHERQADVLARGSRSTKVFNDVIGTADGRVRTMAQLHSEQGKRIILHWAIEGAKEAELVTAVVANQRQYTEALRLLGRLR